LSLVLENQRNQKTSGFNQRRRGIEVMRGKGAFHPPKARGQLKSRYVEGRKDAFKVTQGKL